MFNVFLTFLSFDTLVNRISLNFFVLCEESLVLQAAGQLLATDTRHVVVFLKWILEQIALLHAIAVIQSMDPPQVAAVMMEYGLLVQVQTVKVKSFILRYRLASSDSKL